VGIHTADNTYLDLLRVEVEFIKFVLARNWNTLIAYDNANHVLYLRLKLVIGSLGVRTSAP